MVKKLLKNRYALVVAAACLVLSIPLLTACEEDEEPTGPTPPAFTYPHMNGAEWIYKYQGEDVAKYTISGVYNHPTAGETQNFYEYVRGQGGWQQDALYFLKVSDNDVRLYVDDQESKFFILLKFPSLKDGGSWDAGLGYSANVSGPEDVSVPAGSFSCFKVDYTSGSDSFTFWWPAKVGGMGAKNHGWWSVGTTAITVELSSFNLPT